MGKNAGEPTRKFGRVIDISNPNGHSIPLNVDEDGNVYLLVEYGDAYQTFNSVLERVKIDINFPSYPTTVKVAVEEKVQERESHSID